MRNKKQQRRILKRSKKQENATASDLEGKRVIGSGNIQSPYMKEDAYSDIFLCQCKFTDKASYSLKQKEFQSTRDHAQKMVKTPLWRIDISGEDLAVMEWLVFVQLLKDAGWIEDD